LFKISREDFERLIVHAVEGAAALRSEDILTLLPEAQHIASPPKAAPVCTGVSRSETGRFDDIEIIGRFDDMRFYQ
jgi:hypothetical protein